MPNTPQNRIPTNSSRKRSENPQNRLSSYISTQNMADIPQNRLTPSTISSRQMTENPQNRLTSFSIHQNKPSTSSNSPQNMADIQQNKSISSNNSRRSMAENPQNKVTLFSSPQNITDIQNRPSTSTDNPQNMIEIPPNSATPSQNSPLNFFKRMISFEYELYDCPSVYYTDTDEFGRLVYYTPCKVENPDEDFYSGQTTDGQNLNDMLISPLLEDISVQTSLMSPGSKEVICPTNTCPIYSPNFNRKHHPQEYICPAFDTHCYKMSSRLSEQQERITTSQRKPRNSRNASFVDNNPFNDQSTLRASRKSQISNNIPFNPQEENTFYAQNSPRSSRNGLKFNNNIPLTPQQEFEIAASYSTPRQSRIDRNSFNYSRPPLSPSQSPSRVSERERINSNSINFDNPTPIDQNYSPPDESDDSNMTSGYYDRADLRSSYIYQSEAGAPVEMNPYYEEEPYEVVQPNEPARGSLYPLYNNVQNEAFPTEVGQPDNSNRSLRRNTQVRPCVSVCSKSRYSLQEPKVYEPPDDQGVQSQHSSYIERCYPVDDMNYSVSRTSQRCQPISKSQMVQQRQSQQSQKINCSTINPEAGVTYLNANEVFPCVMVRQPRSQHCQRINCSQTNPETDSTYLPANDTTPFVMVLQPSCQQKQSAARRSSSSPFEMVHQPRSQQSSSAEANLTYVQANDTTPFIMVQQPQSQHNQQRLYPECDSSCVQANDTPFVMVHQPLNQSTQSQQRRNTRIDPDSDVTYVHANDVTLFEMVHQPRNQSQQSQQRRNTRTDPESDLTSIHANDTTPYEMVQQPSSSQRQSIARRTFSSPFDTARQSQQYQQKRLPRNTETDIGRQTPPQRKKAGANKPSSKNDDLPGQSSDGPHSKDYETILQSYLNKHAAKESEASRAAKDNDGNRATKESNPNRPTAESTRDNISSSETRDNNSNRAARDSNASRRSIDSPTRRPSKSSKSDVSPQGSETKPPQKTKDKSIDDIKQDSINMLSVVISTVMLLAAGVGDIPESYKNWSIKYLKCIKNMHGKYPANIKKILWMLTNIEEYNEPTITDVKKCKCPYYNNISNSPSEKFVNSQQLNSQSAEKNKPKET